MVNQLKNNESGFTLIELLIVVVIIGILASIAVPKYNTYIATARSAEAPGMLAAMITYAFSYSQSHDGKWPSTSEWTKRFDDYAVFFVYSYSPGASTLTARGRSRDTRITPNDTLTYNLVTRRWSSSGLMRDIQPVNITISGN